MAPCPREVDKEDLEPAAWDAAAARGIPPHACQESIPPQKDRLRFQSKVRFVFNTPNPQLFW